jgi:hypothetical protein
VGHPHRYLNKALVLYKNFIKVLVSNKDLVKIAENTEFRRGVCLY